MARPLTPGFFKIRIKGLPHDFPIKQLYNYLTQYGGRIDYIGRDTRQSNVAYASWDHLPNREIMNGRHALAYSGQSHVLEIIRLREYPGFLDPPSENAPPIPRRIVLQPAAIQVGIQSGPLEMTQRTILAGRDGSTLSLNAFIKNDMQELVIGFPGTDRRGPHQLSIRFAYIAHVHEEQGPNNTRFMVFTFQHPPKYSAAFDRSQLSPNGNADWHRDRAFQRITAIAGDSSSTQHQPLSVYRSTSENSIDLGRCLTWRLEFRPLDANITHLRSLRNALTAFNVSMTFNTPFTVREQDRSWTWFQLSPFKAVQKPSALQSLHSPDGLVLKFEVWYQLEVALSKKLLYEGNLQSEFFQKLMEPQAEDTLANFIAADKELFDGMDVFSNPELRARRKRRVPKSCVLMHSVTVTPTALLVHPVQVEVSNRVIRKYNDLSDRFLRVRFLDEAYFGRLQSQTTQHRQDEVYERVRNTLVNGIHVGGRHYEFLACGTSQFREHGAYFFAPTEQVTINSIRQWMGYFHHIREIPKYVARIGLCFSTTKAITSIGMQPDIVQIPDIERNGFKFTDGVGKMSPFLAHMVASELRLGVDAPSLYQFRMGGCKGVLAVDPTVKGRTVHIRPSQKKFESDFNQLEIIRVSSFSTAFLNKQIIMVLTTLGVDDKIFVNKTKQQLMEINHALEDDDFAVSMLLQTVDYNQVTVEIAKMLSCGMRSDPFVDFILRLWRAWAIKQLKEKANLAVSQGAFLLGCVDETASLRMDDGKLPEIFLQVPMQNYASQPGRPTQAGKGGSYKVVTGRCIIARNPCLHPGDIRLVQAVDCHKLHHLRDVVVLPQLGERDLANMCAGGDLDGDDFLVIWDPDLLPTLQFDPMDYTGPDPIRSHGPVTQSDMIQFFCDYMRNDSLGKIAVAHRGWADKEWLDSPKCLGLAQLHSMAVDYAKTGVPVTLSAEHIMPKRPHWEGKSPHVSYHSGKVLGQIYDEIERVHFELNPKGYERAFDHRLIEAHDVPDELQQKINALKNEYDADMGRIMAQYGIETEFEIYTSFVMNHNREIKEYKFAEELGGLMSSLKHHYRDLCLEAAGLKDYKPWSNNDKIGVLVVALYKAAADESKQSAMDPDKPLPMLSFPWIFTDELLGVAHMIRSPDKPTLSEAMAWNKASLANMRSGAPTRFSQPAAHIEHVEVKVEVQQSSASVSGASSHGGSEEELQRESTDDSQAASTASTEPSVSGEHGEEDAELGDEDEEVVKPKVNALDQLAAMMGAL